jgi:predicted DCC family thiol-disulfide oxidoreductase YuxK
MLSLISSALARATKKQVPATGIGIFRILYGLVTFQEIIFLLYFNHLIFDPIPYLDIEFPMIPFFLCIWGIVALSLSVGFHCQRAAILNYIFWIIFVCFTPMQRDFDGGFDQFMTGTGLFLIFMPINRAFSIDNLRLKLRSPSFSKLISPPATVSVLAYFLPLGICLGFLYFDSAIHKLFAEHWRNGLGAWLPSTHPYYISAIDMSWLLNIEPLQKIIGYTILAFQFSFIFLFYSSRFRVPLLFIGAGLHLGITLTFNIYPFGMGMLIFYSLMIPFSWWRRIGSLLKNQSPSLSVFYDEMCPLCNRTVITIKHFDILDTIEFKGLQTDASAYPALKSINPELLLTDLYAITPSGKLYKGLDTYIQILLNMRYPALLGLFLLIPGIYHYAAAKYRKIADTRQRITCTSTCIAPPTTLSHPVSFYDHYFEVFAAKYPDKFITRLKKILILILILQLNSTIHYGILYRLNVDFKQSSLMSALEAASNSVLTLSSTFLGITPHALYLHDHFQGYEHILGITYMTNKGEEHWLPFFNAQGRILSPNWGRVHSMWANIAVTPNIDQQRLEKFIMKITAFWGTKIGLNLNKTQFIVKLKEIDSPSNWMFNLRNKNLNNPWTDIGTVNWTNKTVTIRLTTDIEEL